MVVLLLLLLLLHQIHFSIVPAINRRRGREPLRSPSLPRAFGKGKGVLIERMQGILLRWQVNVRVI